MAATFSMAEQLHAFHVAVQNGDPGLVDWAGCEDLVVDGDESGVTLSSLASPPEPEEHGAVPVLDETYDQELLNALDESLLGHDGRVKRGHEESAQDWDRAIAYAMADQIDLDAGTIRHVLADEVDNRPAVTQALGLLHESLPASAGAVPIASALPCEGDGVLVARDAAWDVRQANRRLEEEQRAVKLKREGVGVLVACDAPLDVRQAKRRLEEEQRVRACDGEKTQGGEPAVTRRRLRRAQPYWSCKAAVAAYNQLKADLANVYGPRLGAQGEVEELDAAVYSESDCALLEGFSIIGHRQRTCPRDAFVQAATPRLLTHAPSIPRIRAQGILKTFFFHRRWCSRRKTHGSCIG